MVRLSADASRMKAEFNAAEAGAKASLASISAAAAVAGAAVVAAFATVGVVGVREYAKLEDSMTKSLAIMGNVSDDMKARMEANVRSMAVNGVTSADKLAEAYYFLASAGLDAEASIKALPVVNDFAVAGAFDLAQATELLADNVSALGLASKDATQYMTNMQRVSDVLSTAANVANASQEQFATSLTTKTAAAMRSYKKDVEEGVAALMVLADQGKKAQQAGEIYSSFLAQLQQSSVKNSKEWKAESLALYDVTGALKSTADIVDMLTSKFGPMTDAQRAAKFEQLGLNEMVLQGTLLFMGQGEKLRAYEQRLRTAGGATKEVADKQMQSLVNQFQVFKNNITELSITIGAALAPAIRDMNTAFKAASADSEGFRDAMDSIASVVYTAFASVYNVSVMLIKGWGLVMAVGQSIMVTAFGAIRLVIATVETAFLGIGYVVGMVVNGVIAGWRAFTSFFYRSATKITLSLQEFQMKLWEVHNLFQKGFHSEDAFAGLRKSIEQSRAELAKLEKERQDYLNGGGVNAENTGVNKMMTFIEGRFKANDALAGSMLGHAGYEEDAYSKANRQIWEGIWGGIDKGLGLMDWTRPMAKQVVKAAPVVADTLTDAINKELTDFFGSLRAPTPSSYTNPLKTSLDSALGAGEDNGRTNFSRTGLDVGGRESLDLQRRHVEILVEVRELIRRMANSPSGTTA
jgi:TP901 family phage tail tape measure protein